MWNDPIVEEVRKARDSHAAKYNYDLAAIFQAIKRDEAASGRKFVRLQPKRIEAREVETPHT